MVTNFPGLITATETIETPIISRTESRSASNCDILKAYYLNKVGIQDGYIGRVTSK